MQYRGIRDILQFSDRPDTPKLPGFLQKVFPGAPVVNRRLWSQELTYGSRDFVVAETAQPVSQTGRNLAMARHRLCLTLGAALVVAWLTPFAEADCQEGPPGPNCTTTVMLTVSEPTYTGGKTFCFSLLLYAGTSPSFTLIRWSLMLGCCSWLIPPPSADWIPSMLPLCARSRPSETRTKIASVINCRHWEFHSERHSNGRDSRHMRHIRRRPEQRRDRLQL